MRRRIYHGDVGGKAFEYLESTGHEGLNEPLINSDNCGSSERFLDDHDEEDDWREKRRKEELAWTNIFSRLIAQWAQWFATIVLGSGTWLGVFLHRTLVNYQGDSERVVTLDLSPRQEERLQKLQRRLEVPFDGTRVDHQDALRDLWRAVFPECELIGLISEQWKEMGWQGTDPSTDFRGGGLISLENLIFYAKNYPKSFQRLLHKQEGKRATWEYPFAVAGINISFMLIQMLDLRSGGFESYTGTA